MNLSQVISEIELHSNFYNCTTAVNVSLRCKNNCILLSGLTLKVYFLLSSLTLVTKILILSLWSTSSYEFYTNELEEVSIPPYM